jgi:hypothetical protein
MHVRLSFLSLAESSIEHYTLYNKTQYTIRDTIFPRGYTDVLHKRI